VSKILQMPSAKKRVEVSALPQARPASEQKIRELCQKVVATNDPVEFSPALNELKTAIHEHVSAAQGKLENFRVLIRSKGKAKAAE